MKTCPWCSNEVYNLPIIHGRTVEPTRACDHCLTIMSNWKTRGSPDEFIKCKWCGKPTVMHGTKMCDSCWELHHRITADPQLTKRMLEEVQK